MISGTYFINGLSREFVPYKGYMINGDMKDELTNRYETGPLKVVVDTLSHGNWHTTENILDASNHKILDKGVRKIEYNPMGFYIIEDDNEDELINKYGYIPCDEYWHKTNIVTNDGHLLSIGGFDKVQPSTEGYIFVKQNGLQNLVSLTGEMFFSKNYDFVANVLNGFAFCCDNGTIYKCYKDGKMDRIKHIQQIIKEGSYVIGGKSLEIKDGNIVEAKTYPTIKTFLEGNKGYARIAEACNYGNGERRFNLIYQKNKLIFDNWYLNLEFTVIHGVFFAQDDQGWHLIDILGNYLSKAYDEFITSYSSFSVVRRGQNYIMLDYSGTEIYSNITSVMWADKMIWGMNIATKGKYKHYCNGQTPHAIIDYAHEVLISNKESIFLEREGIWYFANKNNLLPVFKYTLDI